VEVAPDCATRQYRQRCLHSVSRQQRPNAGRGTSGDDVAGTNVIMLKSSEPKRRADRSSAKSRRTAGARRYVRLDQHIGWIESRLNVRADRAKGYQTLSRA